MDDALVHVFDLPDGQQMLRVVARVLLASMLGALLGFEREQARKSAGLRTHMLVSLGAAVFAMVPAEAGMPLASMGPVIQGIAMGIGLIGAGTILKHEGEESISGLTTSAGLWLTAAIGLAVGFGQLWLPLVVVASGWSTLRILGRFTRK